jgi:endoglucanase
MLWMLTCAICVAGAALADAEAVEPPAAEPARAQQAAAQAGRRLGRGINLGNALEAPREGDWGLVLEESHFEHIAKAGFHTVRVPIKWSAHAAPAAPFTIEESFFKRVDWVVEQARRRGLAAVLNVHHFDEIHADPDGQEPALAALWRQIALRYRNEPETVFFELLNEPNGKLTEERWNKMIPGLLSAVRESNPGRYVIVGPGNWNGVHGLEKLLLPEHDRRVIVTFHYYLPFEFTHQGAPWVRGSDRWKGKTWKGTDAEIAALTRDFDRAAAWARRNNRPLFLGEFGAYSAADLESRARWTAAVARAAESRGFSWAYWEFASGFGAFDKQQREWRKPLLDALLIGPAPGAANR